MMEPDEQRVGPRKPVVLKVRFRASTVEEFADRYSRDLSEGGMFVRSPGPLPRPGTLLLLECRLSDGALLINGTATVAWTRSQTGEAGPTGFGVRFDELSPESKAVLAMILETSAGSSTPSFDPPPTPAPTRPAPTQPAVLSVDSPKEAGPTFSAGATRFPTLIGEAPPLPTPGAERPSAKDKPRRPDWFRSHEFDDDEQAAEPKKRPAAAAQEAAPAAAQAPASPTANVPKWFRSTDLLATPPPEAANRGPTTPEPATSTPLPDARATTASVDSSAAPAAPAPAAPAPPAPTPTPAAPRRETGAGAPIGGAPAVETPLASAPEAPEARLARKPPQPPVHLPRPTPAVVAAPRDVEPEPMAAAAGPAGRRVVPVLILGALTVTAFAVGYLLIQFMFPDESAEIRRQLKSELDAQHATQRAPSRAAEPLPAPEPPPEPAAAATPDGTPREPEAQAPPEKTTQPPGQAAEPAAPKEAEAPSVVIPREPPPAPTKRARPRPIVRKKPVREPEPEKGEDSAGGASGSDFQKRLRELERMLKRK